MLGNLRPTQIVGGIRLSEGKEIHPIPFIIIIIIINIIIFGISFMQGIYTYIPETNHVPRERCVPTILM